MNLKDVLIKQRNSLIFGNMLDYVVMLSRADDVDFTNEAIIEADKIVRDADLPEKISQEMFFNRIIPIYEAPLQESSVRIIPEQARKGVKLLLYAGSPVQAQLLELELGSMAKYLIPVSQVYAEKAEEFQVMCRKIPDLCRRTDFAAKFLGSCRVSDIKYIARFRS